MEYINIQTSQNVEIESQIAGLGDRILAGIVDFLIMVSYAIFMGSVFDRIFNNDFFILIIILPLLFYHLLSELIMNGQSAGKRVIKIKVVSLNGSHVTFGSYLLRWIFRLIENPILMMDVVGIITMAINGKGQRLGDIVAGTTVISLKKKIDLANTMFVSLPENYVVQINEVSMLSARDISTVNEVLNTYYANRESEEVWQVVIRTKIALEIKMKTNNMLTPVEFLKTVIADYNYLNLNPQ